MEDIRNMKFLNALIVSVIREVFASVKRDALSAREITQPPTAHARENLRMLNIAVRRQPRSELVNKDCLKIYKKIFPHITEAYGEK